MGIRGVSLLVFILTIFFILFSFVSAAPICSSRFIGPTNLCGVNYKPSHSYDNSSSTYKLKTSLTNNENRTKTIEFEMFACRCDESAGNPLGKCVEYWPFINYTGISHKFTCPSLGRRNITLAPFQQINITANASQYRNAVCGSFQLDFEVYRSTGCSINNSRLVSAGILNLCTNCTAPRCGDGFKDQGEQCDDGNRNNTDLCSNDCKLIKCLDLDRDRICDHIDKCPDSKIGEPVDKDGCDPFQFCSGFVCGPLCFMADWMNNEPNKQFPKDCKVVITQSNGIIQQPKCVPTIVSNQCFG